MSQFKNQILMLRARIADGKKRLKDLELRAEAHRISVQQKMDPYSDLKELELDSVRVSVEELLRLQNSYIEIADQITEMENDLDG
jgi:hypothetical protein